jgi:hypothetical protein
MISIELRLDRRAEIVGGRPVSECLHQVHGRLRGVAVGAGLTDDVKYVELIVTRDEHGLDRNIEPLRVSINVPWTMWNVFQSGSILDYIEGSILAILAEYDPDNSVVSQLQVVLIVGGQRRERLNNRRRRHSEESIDPTITRTIQGKNPFGFD